MALAISPRGIDFIKSWESFVGYVYDDKLAPVNTNGKRAYREWDGSPPRGTLTIGYGHTNAAKHPLKITRNLRVTEAQACEILDVDLDDCELAVNRLVKVDLTQGQFDALVSLTFNMGEGNLRKSSLLAKLNKGDYAGARRAFDLYVKSGGEFMQGLQNRRDGEQALWDANYTAPVKPHEEIIEHPAEVDAPAPVEIKPLVKSKSIWGGIFGWFTSIGGSFFGLFDKLDNPYTLTAFLVIVVLSSIAIFLVIKGRIDVNKIVTQLSEEAA